MKLKVNEVFIAERFVNDIQEDHSNIIFEGYTLCQSAGNEVALDLIKKDYVPCVNEIDAAQDLTFGNSKSYVLPKKKESDFSNDCEKYFVSNNEQYREKVKQLCAILLTIRSEFNFKMYVHKLLETLKSMDNQSVKNAIGYIIEKLYKEEYLDDWVLNSVKNLLILSLSLTKKYDDSLLQYHYLHVINHAQDKTDFDYAIHEYVKYLNFELPVVKAKK